MPSEIYTSEDDKVHEEQNDAECRQREEEVRFVYEIGTRHDEDGLLAIAG